MLPFSLSESDTFSLTFVYDSTTPDAREDPTGGIYRNAIQQVRLNIGSFAFEASFGNIGVFNDWLAPASLPVEYLDMWTATVLAGEETLDDLTIRRSRVTLLLWHHIYDPTLTPLDNDALLGPPWPAAWQVAEISYVIADYTKDGYPVGLGETARASAIIRTLSVAPAAVPLPGAAWPFAMAMAASFMGSRRRRRSIE